MSSSFPLLMDSSLLTRLCTQWVKGQITMDENLGREVEELNGIQYENMLSTYAEKRLEDGDIGLVPDVSDAAS